MARDITNRVSAPATPDTYAGAPVRGRVVWSPVKVAWFALSAVPAALFAVPTAAPGPVLTWLGLSVLSLCGGHSLGMHRWLTHRSFQCPRWLGELGVWLGTLTGLGGPVTMMRTHDLRDWAQRQEHCYPFFSQNAPIALDTARQIGARFEVEGADFQPSARVTGSRALQALQRTSMLQDGVLALVLLALGGWPYVVWGVCVRVTVPMLGHSLVGLFAHNRGPGWWVLKGLERVGLVWDLREADSREGLAR